MQILNTAQSTLMRRVRDRLHQEGFETRFTPGDEPGSGRLVVRGQGTKEVFTTKEVATGLDGSDWRAVMGADVSVSKSPPKKRAAILVIAPVISDVSADEMWESGVSFFDAKEGCLRFPDLILEIGPGESRARPKRRPDQEKGRPLRHAMTPAALSVGLLALLDAELLALPLREVAELVPASLGTVQGAISALEAAGLASRKGRLLAPEQLLNIWTSAYLTHYSKWHGKERYESDLPLQEVLERVTTSGEEPPIWISGEAALESQGRSIRSTTMLVYADPEDQMRLRKLLRLRRSDSGSIEIAKTMWRPALAPLPFAPSPVLRADLLASRDPRQAELIQDLERDDPVLRRLTHSG